MNIWTNGDDLVLWKNFTDNGLPTGNPLTMAVGDSFKINYKGNGLWGGNQVGVSLLSSPSATAVYADRNSNYAVQIKMDGISNASTTWEIVSSGGTVTTSTVTTNSGTYGVYELIFTLETATTLTVVINKYGWQAVSPWAYELQSSSSDTITLNNSNITGYSIYASGWMNGEVRFLQPTEHLTSSLGIEDYDKLNSVKIYHYDSKIHVHGIDNADKYNLEVYDLLGRLVQTISENNSNVSLVPSIYIVKLEIEGKGIITHKIVVK